jgi:tRNA(fMet)-specific endonuclease VapC
LILDTNALSDMIDGEPGLLALLRTAPNHEIPSVVLGEFRFGLLRSRSRPERERWLAKVENQMRVLDVTRATAHQYALIREELRTAGTPIPSNDIWIAALAREHGLAVLSRDAHFDSVPGIHRFGW